MIVRVFSSERRNNKKHIPWDFLKYYKIKIYNKCDMTNQWRRIDNSEANSA